MQLASFWWQQEELSPESLRVFCILGGLRAVSICGSIKLGKPGSGNGGAYFEECLVELDDLWLENFRSRLLRKGRGLHNVSGDLQTTEVLIIIVWREVFLRVFISSGQDTSHFVSGSSHMSFHFDLGCYRYQGIQYF